MDENPVSTSTYHGRKLVRFTQITPSALRLLYMTRHELFVNNLQRGVSVLAKGWDLAHETRVRIPGDEEKNLSL